MTVADEKDTLPPPCCITPAPPTPEQEREFAARRDRRVLGLVATGCTTAAQLALNGGANSLGEAALALRSLAARGLLKFTETRLKGKKLPVLLYSLTDAGRAIVQGP